MTLEDGHALASDRGSSSPLPAPIQVVDELHRDPSTHDSLAIRHRGPPTIGRRNKKTRRGVPRLLSSAFVIGEACMVWDMVSPRRTYEVTNRDLILQR
jgi:hypothetical protein